MRSFSRLATRGAAVIAFAVVATPPADPLLGPGVSRELAARRSGLISAVRYDLRLSLQARDTAHGSIVVRFAGRRSRESL
jgi:hypothetical protein